MNSHKLHYNFAGDIMNAVVAPQWQIKQLRINMKNYLVLDVLENSLNSNLIFVLVAIRIIKYISIQKTLK